MELCVSFFRFRPFATHSIGCGRVDLPTFYALSISSFPGPCVLRSFLLPYLNELVLPVLPLCFRSSCINILTFLSFFFHSQLENFCLVVQDSLHTLDPHLVGVIGAGANMQSEHLQDLLPQTSFGFTGQAHIFTKGEYARSPADRDRIDKTHRREKCRGERCIPAELMGSCGL